MVSRIGEFRSAEPVLATGVLEDLASELAAIRKRLIASEAGVAHLLEAVHPENLPSARNLVHYLALRRNDLRELQHRLSNAGLSSLSGCEAHVLATLDSVRAMLRMATHKPA